MDLKKPNINYVRMALLKSQVYQSESEWAYNLPRIDIGIIEDVAIIFNDYKLMIKIKFNLIEDEYQEDHGDYANVYYDFEENWIYNETVNYGSKYIKSGSNSIDAIFYWLFENYHLGELPIFENDDSVKSLKNKTEVLKKLIGNRAILKRDKWTNEWEILTPFISL